MDNPSGSRSPPRTAVFGNRPGAATKLHDDAKYVNNSQLELFEANLPDKPWCSDDDHGRYPRVLPRNAARRRRYIQPQPPWLRVWMVFDVDRDASWYAADERTCRRPPSPRSTDRTATAT